jgi:type IV pilus assembly protein PilB
MSLRMEKILSIALDLVKEGQIQPAQLDFLSESEAVKNDDVGIALVKRGVISEEQLNERLAKKAGVRVFSLKNFTPMQNVLRFFTPAQAQKWRMFPVLENRGKLVVATTDPFDVNKLDDARGELGREIDCVLISNTELNEAINRFYAEAPPIIGKTNAATQNTFEKVSNFSQPRVNLGDNTASETTSIVDNILQNACENSVSDVHFEPTRDELKVRFRIDGVLELYRNFPLAKHPSILSRLKIMGGMDVAEQRIPQDGRTTIQHNGKDVDVRMASYPTMFGEAAALRLLSKSIITLEELGFSAKDQEVIEKVIHRPHGIFLVTGPTGSGKTSTLYAALQKIDRKKLHALSVEDPVENEIEGVAQTQINVRAGLTFPIALRSMLRQDPDVIMVGEIRDQETADISLRAAMTGHLVLSTLHTNNATGSVGRLTDLGVENYLISATLLGVAAQRLVRKICVECREEVEVSPNALKKLGPAALGLKAFKGKGCSACKMRGYKGRIGIFEIFFVDDEVKVLIATKAPEVRLREKNASLGFKSMREDGISKIKQGITTIEEVIKACGDLGDY